MSHSMSCQPSQFFFDTFQPKCWLLRRELLGVPVAFFRWRCFDALFLDTFALLIVHFLPPSSKTFASRRSTAFANGPSFFLSGIGAFRRPRKPVAEGETRPIRTFQEPFESFFLPFDVQTIACYRGCRFCLPGLSLNPQCSPPSPFSFLSCSSFLPSTFSPSVC